MGGLWGAKMYVAPPPPKLLGGGGGGGGASYMFCPNTGTKFHEPYHSNHMIPRLVYIVLVLLLI